MAPASLDFPPTWVGHPSSLEISLKNTGRSPLRGALEADEPFHVDQATWSLQGLETRRIPVRFAPVAPGTWEAALRIGSTEVSLRGIATKPPECPASNPCRSVSFNPATGLCEEERVDDDTPCGDACFDGVCVEGECVGEEFQCESEDRCMVGDCVPLVGCVYYDISQTCRGNDNPCVAPSCDPDDGCSFANVEDGTSCGPADCTVSMVCMDGICTERTTPDGGECGEETPCQDRGRCDRGACIQEAPRVLEPTWGMSARGSATLHFDGTIDKQGHVYWAECLFDSCDLVSMTAGGVPRYRIRMFESPVGRAPTGSLGLANGLLISTFAPGAVQALDTQTGAEVWRRDLLSVVEAEGVADLQLDEAAPPVIGRNHVAVAVRGALIRGGESEDYGGWVVGLELASGEPLWVHQEAGDFVGLIGDEGGSIVYTSRRFGAGAAERGEIVSRTPSGEERWREPAPYQAPLLTLGGRVLFAGGEMRHMAGGTPGSQLELLFPAWPRKSPLLAGDVGYAHGVTLVECGDGLCPSWESHLIRFDASTGETSWTAYTGGQSISELVMTRNLSVILARARHSGPVVVELAEDPEAPVFECRLPPGRFEGKAALFNGSWFIADESRRMVFAFDLKGRRPPDRGWVGYRGGGETSGRPQ